MKKYFFTKQISKKLRTIDKLPDWLSRYMHFKNQIKTLREALGMTQEQLGKMVGLSWRSIQNIESGNAMPKISTLFKIADALNSELKIFLIPRKDITIYLDEKATQKAKQLVKFNYASSNLEVQSPSKDETKDEMEMLKRTILEKHRHVLWNQSQQKK